MCTETPKERSNTQQRLLYGLWGGDCGRHPRRSTAKSSTRLDEHTATHTGPRNAKLNGGEEKDITLSCVIIHEYKTNEFNNALKKKIYIK